MEGLLEVIKEAEGSIRGLVEERPCDKLVFYSESKSKCMASE
jgi:hypothetical protein